MGTLAKSRGLLFLALLVLLISVGSTPAAGVTGVVDSLLAKYKNAGQGWVGTLKSAGTSIFWILATISFSWTCISMAIKRAEMGEFLLRRRLLRKGVLRAG